MFTIYYLHRQDICKIMYDSDSLVACKALFDSQFLLIFNSWINRITWLRSFCLCKILTKTCVVVCSRVLRNILAWAAARRCRRMTGIFVLLIWVDNVSFEFVLVELRTHLTLDFSQFFMSIFINVNIWVSPCTVQIFHDISYIQQFCQNKKCLPLFVTAPLI